jgi:SAM-dependent methyltransferase
MSFGWMVASLRGEARRVVRRVLQHAIYRAPGERDDCPACGSLRVADLDVLPLRGGRTGFVSCCEACGLVFSNPQPSLAVLQQFYSPSGAWSADRPDSERKPNSAAAKVGGHWTRWFRPIRQEMSVTSPRPGSRVLDFGCGEGTFLDALQNCGWETWGIEPSHDRAFARHRRLDEVPAVPSFDLVLAVHVLEHLPDPLATLRKLAAACRPGGHLFLCVPRLDTLPYHRDYRYVLNGRQHITAYTWPCLRTLMARAGWEAVGEPPLEVPRGGGRTTTAKLCVLARRTDGRITAARAPARAARSAIRRYYAAADSRPLPARLGCTRVAARRADAVRQCAKAARRVAKQVQT